MLLVNIIGDQPDFSTQKALDRGLKIYKKDHLVLFSVFS